MSDSHEPNNSRELLRESGELLRESGGATAVGDISVNGARPRTWLQARLRRTLLRPLGSVAGVHFLARDLTAHPADDDGQFGLVVQLAGERGVRDRCGGYHLLEHRLHVQRSSDTSVIEQDRRDHAAVEAHVAHP